ncbi:Smr/MutS family protein [Ampullimonas aquatilis]|uniref:Smr/MutS family protein n=1 Tax=Ampullimonas aquatilis TaxID=1341549 RepID=UPI003C7659B5
MKTPIKQLSDLKQLRDSITQEAEQRAALAKQQAATAMRQEKEANLFRHAVGAVAPLKQAPRVAKPQPIPQPIARHSQADEAAVLRESLSDEFDAESLLDTDDELSYTRPGIGQDVVRRLRRGEWVIQAQLDLHGLRRDEAREALGEFLRRAIKSGQRCVRVIHGKGLGSVNKEPVLKGKVRSWLVQKDEVLAFCQARAQDGGSGAIVVLLRSS